MRFMKDDEIRKAIYEASKRDGPEIDAHLAKLSNLCPICDGRGWIWNCEMSQVGLVNVQRPCPGCRPKEAVHNPKPVSSGERGEG